MRHFLIALSIVWSLLSLPVPAFGQEPPPLPSVMPPLPSIQTEARVNWNQSFEISSYPGPSVTVAVGEKVDIQFSVELADGTFIRDFSNAPFQFSVKQSNGRPKLECVLSEGRCSVSSDMLGTAVLTVWNAAGTFGYHPVNIIFVREWYTGRDTLILATDMAQTNEGQTNGLSVIFPRAYSGDQELILLSRKDGEFKYSVLRGGVPMGKRIRILEKSAVPLRETHEPFCVWVVDMQTGSSGTMSCATIRGKYGIQQLKAEINDFGDLQIQGLGIESRNEYRAVLLRGDQFYLELEHPLFEQRGDGFNRLVFYKNMQGYDIALPWGTYTVALISNDGNGNTYTIVAPNALELDRNAQL